MKDTIDKKIFIIRKALILWKKKKRKRRKIFLFIC